MTNLDRRNKYCFGLGTIGRDMFYSLESMYLLFFLTEVRQLDDAMLALVGGVLTVLRILDAFNDPITGVIIDNTHSRWGKFKPWILTGALVSALCLLVLFGDIPVTGAGYVVIFALAYHLWDIFYGVNDIAYWTLLPGTEPGPAAAGALRRLRPNLRQHRMYAVVVGVLPATSALTDAFGGDGRKGWFTFAVIVCVLMIGFQLFTLLGVKERRDSRRRAAPPSGSWERSSLPMTSSSGPP